jgi:hypothetical protein
MACPADAWRCDANVGLPLYGQKTLKPRISMRILLYVDGAKFSTITHQSGSTRTRIVLAFHATLLEVALARGGNHPGWLLFDAPKQHELSQTDFDAHMDNLAILASKYPQRVQVVFSVADLKTQIQAADEVWLPKFTTRLMASPVSYDLLTKGRATPPR